MNRNDSLKCAIEDGVLTIRIGVEMIGRAAKLNPELAEYDETLPAIEWIEPEVTDVDQFAAEVCQQITYEEEDGTSSLHRMLDEAIIEAIENGAEGIKTPRDIIRERRATARSPQESE